MKIIYIQLLFIFLCGCQGEKQIAPILPTGVIGSSADTAIFDSVRFYNFRELQFIDSITKSTEQNNFIFLNYPEFISEELYNRITEINLKTGKLDSVVSILPYSKVSSGFRIYFDDSELNELMFLISPKFENNKLISIELDGELPKTKRNLVKKIFDYKYGNSIKATINKKPGDIKWYTLTVDRYTKIERTSECNYRYSKSNKIVILTEVCTKATTNKYAEDSIKEMSEINIAYYTTETYKFFENKAMPPPKSKHDKKTIEKSQQDL